MVSISSTELTKEFGKIRDMVQREPVEVTVHNRATAYLISVVDYKEYLRLKEMETKALSVSELSTQQIQEVAASRMDSRHDHLNSLLDE